MSDKAEAYRIYKSLIEKVMLDPEQLPSLPSVTLKIRNALADSNITNQQLADISAQDPAFATLLLATASSPLYLQASPPRTLAEVSGILGLRKIDSIAMSHAVKSLFLLKNSKLKALYTPVWERLILKASISSFICSRLRTESPEEVMLAALLSEIGTLAIISAFKDSPDVPDKRTFFRLCRQYSKGFGAVLLTKWKVKTDYINVMKLCGYWKLSNSGAIDALDYVNLGLYATIKITKPRNTLPGIEEMPSYQKLKFPYDALDETGNLSVVSNNLSEIGKLKEIFSL